MATKHEEMTEDIRGAEGASGGITLTQWEEEFMESIEGRLADGKSLTDGQIEKLEGIWARV